MFNKILVPLDGSELAERALDPALALGRTDGSDVILLRVLSLEPRQLSTVGYGVVWPDQPLERLQVEAREYLESISSLKTRPNLRLHTQVSEGDVAGAIVDTAASKTVRLIAMSTHGYSGITRWVMGSVTEKVMRAPACPVMAIRSTKPISKILITLDGSDFSEQALAPGFEVANRLDGEVALLRAVSNVNIGEVAQLEEIERGLGRRLQGQMYDEAETYLGALATRHQRAGLNIQATVKIGPAAEGILEFADAHETDLIVMATHGRTGLQRWTYGSVTEKVLRGARCSLLIVRAPAQQSN